MEFSLVFLVCLVTSAAAQTTQSNAGCGATSYYGPSGVISSPNYPGNYYDNLDCDYYIYTSTGSSFTIIFKSFDVEDIYDYVTISCPTNSSFPPQSYSGNSLPDAVSIPWCSQGLVNLRTDSSTVAMGFSLNYYISVGGCGNTTYSGPNGFVTSPNYPGPYGYNHNCSNIIWVPERSTFHLNFEYFAVSDQTCCTCDWLEIRCIDNADYGPYRYCGVHHFAELYIRRCSQVLLWFHSDDATYYPGFKIQYNGYPDAETTTVAGTPDYTQTTYTPPVSTLKPGCRQETRIEPSGVLISPNYPGNYYNGLSCYYYIYTTRASSISFIFEDFHVQDSLDYLRIYCERNSSFPAQNYTGQTLPPPLVITWCSKANLYFYTDSNTVFSGFSIDYYLSDGDCGYTVHNGSIGYVTSPNYPTNYNYYQNCSNIIWAPQRSHFHLHFLFLELQDCGSCPQDWVEISCLDNNPSDKHRFCGTSHYPVDFYQCSQVLVLFHSDGSGNYQGFNLEYYVYPDSENTFLAGTTDLPQTNRTSHVSTLEPGCYEYHCGPSGTITSPNYPGNYNDSLKCYYYINALPGSSITLIFEHFHLQDDTDYITVSCPTNSSFPEQRYSGHTLPQPLTIPWCSQASLYFQTDTSEVYSGFSIDYYVSDGGCGNTVYTGSVGNVTSPNYPSAYSYFQNCSNIILAPQRSHFHLSFLHIYIDHCDYCFCDWVEISCLDNNPSYTQRFCASIETTLDLYQCTQVLVWFHSDGYNPGFSGFNIEYNVYPMLGCGDESYYGPSGVISSANYPDDYHDSLYCDHNIYTSSSSGSIAIIFQAFNTEECCDYVTISCATNSSYSPVTYSGSSLPQSVSVPWCSQGRVNFRTDNSVASTGFSLDYHVSLGGCGDTVYTGEHGYVSSPNYPNNYGDNQNCSNIIWAYKSTSFDISFLYMNLEACCDFVELSCVDNPSYGKRRFTGDTIPPTETIPQCTQVLVWFFSDDSTVYEGFNLEYYATPGSDDPNVLDNRKPNPAEKVSSNRKPNAAEKVPSNGKPNPAEKVPSNGKPNAAEKVSSNGKPNPAEKVPSNGKRNAAEKVPSNGKPNAAEK